MARYGLQIPNFAADVAGELKVLRDVGVESFIFNMPFSDPEGVRRAGAFLGDALA